MKYIIQNGIMRKEREAVLLCQKPHIHATIDFIRSLSDLSNLIPVGSVEFVNEFSRLSGISLPENISYPQELTPFLKRSLRQDMFSNVGDELFVKPVKTKIFTGGIKKDLKESVNPDEQVWVSEPLDIEAEFRYYVLDGMVVGHSRYDDGDNEAEPDENVVNQIIGQYKSQPAGYAIDVGIVNGETILIEVNDGWALGYYPWGDCSKTSYVELITKRWEQIARRKK